MAKKSIEMLRNMQEVPDRLNDMSTRAPRAVKLGSSTSHYYYADQDELRMKSGGIGIIMNKDKSVVNPGSFLSFQVPYQAVDFNGLAFHPAADIPSTAVFPHPTVSQKFIDPSITLVQGVYSSLKSLT